MFNFRHVQFERALGHQVEIVIDIGSWRYIYRNQELNPDWILECEPAAVFKVMHLVISARG